MKEDAQTKNKYRFGIVLSTALGNSTRYENFKRFAELDDQIEFTWAPVKHYLAPEERNPFRWLPRFLQSRAVVLLQAWPVLGQMTQFDAVLIHMYEVDLITALRSYFFQRPKRVISADDAPILDPSTYPIHPVDLNKPRWKRRVRLQIDLWRARRADALVPFSPWAADIFVLGAHLPRDRVTPVHVGLDVAAWRFQPRSVVPGKRVQLLFVGGDFVRKGGSLLLDVFTQHFSDVAELHLVTKTFRQTAPPGVTVYDNLNANDEELASLYRKADIFILPTTSDLSSWVALEAMASGCAVITTPVGGIVNIINDADTGILIHPGDADGLRRAVRGLIDDPIGRIEMGRRARKAVEQDFNAAINVPKILAIMKKTVARQ